MRFQKTILILLTSFIFVENSVSDGLPDAVTPFLESHCYDCHDDLSEEGDLNLLDLEFDPDHPKNLEQWVHIFDRVRSSEMPPSDKPQPATDVRETFLAHLKAPLIKAEQALTAKTGRARVRRLNRAEFESSLSDLFEVPLRIQRDLPEDAKSHGFATVGAALNVSSVQMEAYLNVLDGVLDEATTLYTRPKRRTHRLTYREEHGMMQVYRRGGPFQIRDDGVAFFATEKFSHLNAVLSHYTVPHKARYRIKVSAYALRSDEPVIVSLRAGGTGHAESNHVPHVFLDHFPVKEGDPQVFEWEGWLERGHYFHVYPTSLRPMRFTGQVIGEQEKYNGPAAVVQWVEVDGPIYEEWPPASHKALWGDLPTKKRDGAQANEDPIAHLDKPPSKIAMPKMTRGKKVKETGATWTYDPNQPVGGEPIHKAASKPKPIHSTRSLVSASPREDASRLIKDFATRALRRPVSKEDITPYIALTHRWLDEGRDFESAMRVSYKALLTSPEFLYHRATLPDASPNLDGAALAERLAFFLWNGLPDQRLRALAESEKLKDPTVLKNEVERLLGDEKSNRFLKDFTDQWLDLRLIDFTVPDDKLYPEFDPLLEWSMVEETRAFVRKMLDEDLSTTQIIDSNFAMVNSRLARHYGFAPLEGMKVRSVPLPDNSVRGGLITQGSILKVTANGTTTSPVVRGVWMMERIMGETPNPPPPGIPAIEPDIRGATTVREQLDKHSSSESCASCHQKIDPPGLALENFDVIGGWRDHYRTLNSEMLDLKVRFGPKTDIPIRYLEGPPVDASYKLADGRSFENIEDFKKILLEDPRRIARGLVEKFIIYSTGAEVSFSDTIEVDTILDRAEKSNFGFRTLIHEVVQSSLFHQK